MDSLVSFSRVIIVISTFFILSLIDGLGGTLTPDGTVPLDCGSQPSFTCSVTGVLAGWTISRLNGISATGTSGQSAADNNARITTTNSSDPSSSTITITGFTTEDNGGTIQCINLANNSVQGMASISVEQPSCPTSFSANRDGDFTSATATYQLATPPPVTFTTVTYCPTSSPNCVNSMNCTTSPCTISGLDPCMNYSLTAIPNNYCGSPTGCTGNSMVVAPQGQGVPSCPSSVVAVAHDDNDAITVTWQQPPNTPPVASTTVTYCPTSSPNCGNSMNCTSPCTIGGLDPGTEYQFTVIPNNNCGSPTGCTGNNATTQTACMCPKCTSQPSPAVEAPLLAGIILMLTVVLLLANVISVVVAVLITRHCYRKTSQTSSPSKGEGVYEQVEGPKTYEDIVMTDSPAYGPVK